MGIAASFPGFKLRLTRWGALYIAASIVLAFAAINTGNNALMSALGLVLASFAISGSWSREVLGKAAVTITPPPEAYAGSPTIFRLHLGNHSRFLPAYGLVVRDGDGNAVHTEALLDAGRTCERAVEVTLPKRGWVNFDDWRVEVLLPLGFFAKSKVVARGQRLLVFPRLLPASRLLPQADVGEVATERFEDRGREGTMSQLREFVDGDEPRQIHWKQTARQDHLITMEREHPLRSSVVFVVDTRVDDPDDEQQRQRFERLMSEVATAIVRRLERGIAVGLSLPDAQIPPVRLRRHLPRLLEPLAEAKPLPPQAPAPQGR